MKSFMALINRKMDQFIADPQISPIEMMRKKVAFNWTLGTAISIVVLTILAYTLDADIIGHYGVVLIIFYFIQIPVFRHHNFDLYQSIFLAALIITTFMFILIFGGYRNSAGLIFVGLTCVISSTLNKSVKAAFLLFFLYLATIIGLAILDPFLTPHPDITSGINFTFFIINTIWMSAAMMFFINTYLADRNKYQLAETNRLQELDDAKSQLFTNITHEFRTPITLIDGMADQIPPGGTETAEAIAQIKKQSKKLLSLVNQILDLSKIESNTIKTNFIQDNIIDYLKYLFESFQSAADLKGILFHYQYCINELIMDFDPEKLEAIVVNLVSNAIKFTPDGGKVIVMVNENSGYLEIVVQDSGIGIPSDELHNIFKRFHRVKRDGYYEGNGIGLTIVKEFLKLMNGRVEVISELNKGSTFKILFPITQNAPKKSIGFRDFKPVKKVESEVEDKKCSNELPLLLIIDDHQDILVFLKTLLRQNYRLIEATNGKAGFEMVLEHVPDIIISDVMMPQMDGFEFLKRIKMDIRSSHIPVLMLTAKADRLSKLAGLELGAEAFLIKPFDKEELFIRLRKLLDLRKILINRYKTFDLSSLAVDKTMGIEDKFMKKIHEVIDAHIDDELFNISELCRELAMSHTQLYRKFSALTDVTVNKYIRRYRLHKGMDLLKHTDLNISQIALEVGLPNLAYFSRVFSEEFKINPSKVRKSKTFQEKNVE